MEIFNVYYKNNKFLPKYNCNIEKRSVFQNGSFITMAMGSIKFNLDLIDLISYIYLSYISWINQMNVLKHMTLFLIILVLCFTTAIVLNFQAICMVVNSLKWHIIFYIVDCHRCFVT